MQKPAISDESAAFAALRVERAREMLLLGVLVCGLGCGAESRAEDRERLPPDFETARDTRLSGIAPRFDVGARCVPETPTEPEAFFAPHATLASATAAEPQSAPTPALLSTSLWQRLNDYRSNNRIRLLTLWQTTGSALSLQAGRHGEPSLQWTSRALNRGGSTRGLLDHLVAKSLGAAGIGTSAAGTRAGTGSTSAAVRPVRPASPLPPPGRAP